MVPLHRLAKSLRRLTVLLGLVALVGCLPLPADVLKKVAQPAGKAPSGQTVTAAPAPPSGVEVVTAPAAPNQVAHAAPAAPATNNGRLWVVVRNLQVVREFGASNQISADWEVVQGSPEPGARYVLRVSDGESSGPIEHYVDFDIDLAHRKGSVREGVRGMTLGIRGGIIAVVGKTQGFGRGELEEVSGRCRIGSPSDAAPAPTVVEAAGPAAQGMHIAIANPRHEGRGIGSPRGGWSIDYKVQGTLAPGDRYFWVVEDSSGNGGVEFDVTTDLAYPGRASEGTISGTSFGPGRLHGPLKMYIERRGLGFNAAKTIVSNTVTLN
jgi:hypothetical protein